MRNDEKKDELIGSLFAEYVEESDLPPEEVTLKARKFLQKSPERVEVRTPVYAEERKGGESTHRARKIPAPVFILAGIMIIVAVALIIAHALNGNNPLTTSNFNIVSRAQLAEITRAYARKDFLSFVESDSVTVYKEYALTEKVSNHNQGEVVAYYLEYAETDDVSARLYVENNFIALDELTYYEDMTGSYSARKITFKVNGDATDNLTYVYFTYGDYTYYLIIGASRQADIETILDRIDGNF